MNIAEILGKLPADALETLKPEEKAFLVKETMDLDDLVSDNLELEEANTLGLRIFSLLSGVEAGDESELSTELQALSYFEDRDLIGLFKKLVKLNCYKLRKTKKAEAEKAPVVDSNPLSTL